MLLEGGKRRVPAFLNSSFYYFKKYLLSLLLLLPTHAREQGKVIDVGVHIYICIYYIPPPLTVHFPMTRSVRYQPIFNGLKFMLHRACVLNNVVITTVIEMVEMVERVRYVINNLLHLVIVKYGVISLVLCISTHFQLVTILNAIREISCHISRRLV